jgi:hypothetical protein
MDQILKSVFLSIINQPEGEKNVKKTENFLRSPGVFVGVCFGDFPGA